MTTPYLRPVVDSYTQGSPLAYLTTSIRSLLPAHRFIVAACPLSEEYKALPTRTMSPSITHTKSPRSATQHSAMNASNCSPTTKSRTAPVMDNVASVTVTSMNQYFASPHTCVAANTSARYPVGTTTMARIAPQTPSEGLTAL